MRLLTRFAAFLIRRAEERPPDFVIGEPDAPYLLRWYLWPRNRWFNAYLHKFLQGDDPRALHDHPWVNCSIVLRGLYFEHLTNGRTVKRTAGQVVARRAVTAHRISLRRDCDQPLPAWSLFITGPVTRSWE